MTRKPLIVDTVQTFEFPIETMIWNYLDGEHLEFVHDGYARPRALVLHGDVSLFISRLKFPGLPISFKATNLTFIPRFGEQVTVTTMSFATSRTTINISPNEGGGSIVKTEYAWFLPRLISPFAPILRRLILRWNQAVNLEDMPLRTRRTFLVSKGFKDFHGMQSGPSARRATMRLPLRTPDDSPLNQGPFVVRTHRRLTIDFESRNLAVDQTPER